MTTKKKTAKKVSKKKAAAKKAPAKRPPVKAAPAKAKAFNPYDCSGAQLGEVLGLTQQQVLRLFKARTIPQNGKSGRYDIFKAVPQYVQSIKTSGTAEAGERLKIEQRRKLKLQNDTAAGILVPLADIASVINQAAAGFLATWKSIPRRVAAKLAATDDSATVREILENESSNARAELAAPIRKFYVDRKQALPDFLADTLDGKQATPAKPGTVGRRKPRAAKRKR